MCKIYIIAGHTGAGKSTVTKKIHNKYGYPVISFAEMGKDFSSSKGYKRLRDCYAGMEKDVFVPELINHIKLSLNSAIKDNDCILIDGLYVFEIIQHLREANDVVVIFMDVSQDNRVKRIANRLNTSLENAANEIAIKEEIKFALGMNELLCIADYTIKCDAEPEIVMKKIESILQT